MNFDALAAASNLLYVEDGDSFSYDRSYLNYGYPAAAQPDPSLPFLPGVPPSAVEQETSAAHKPRVAPQFFIAAQVSEQASKASSAVAALPAPQAAAIAPPQPRPQPFVHTVGPGESLNYLANRYGISVDTLRWVNRLDDPDALPVGTKLTILPVSGVLHSVREGDTLLSVANRYQVQISDIVQFNKIADPDHLALDLKLIVPGGRIPDPPRVAPSARGATVAAPAPAPAQPAARVVNVSAPPAAPRAPAPPAAAAPPRSPIELDVANQALQYVGYPYVWGGASPRGFDCSGFVQYVFRQKGVSLPRDVWGQIQVGTPVGRDNLRPGDVVFFQNTYMPGLSHDGIYVGGGQFVHANDPSSGVTVSSLSSSYWAPRWYGARRMQ